MGMQVGSALFLQTLLFDVPSACTRARRCMVVELIVLTKTLIVLTNTL